MLVFEERGKPEFPEKNLSDQSREPTNSAHICRRVRESNPGHIGGRRALSPLHQPCSLVGIVDISGIDSCTFLIVTKRFAEKKKLKASAPQKIHFFTTKVILEHM